MSLSGEYTCISLSTDLSDMSLSLTSTYMSYTHCCLLHGQENATCCASFAKNAVCYQHKYLSACWIRLVHNHPSGKPSSTFFSLIAIALQLEVVRDVIYVTYVSLRNELMPMLTVIIKSKSFNWGLTKHHGQV